MGRGYHWVYGGRPINVDGRGPDVVACSRFGKAFFLIFGLFGLDDAWYCCM